VSVALRHSCSWLGRAADDQTPAERAPAKAKDAIQVPMKVVTILALLLGVAAVVLLWWGTALSVGDLTLVGLVFVGIPALFLLAFRPTS
jgi:hypothetical protein